MKASFLLQGLLVSSLSGCLSARVLVPEDRETIPEAAGGMFRTLHQATDEVPNCEEWRARRALCECAAVCPAVLLGDGVCDPQCNIAVCVFDGSDCLSDEEEAAAPAPESDGGEACEWLQPLLGGQLAAPWVIQPNLLERYEGELRVWLWPSGAWESEEPVTATIAGNEASIRSVRRGLYDVDCAAQQVTVAPFFCSNQTTLQVGLEDPSVAEARRGNPENCLHDIRFRTVTRVSLTPQANGNVVAQPEGLNPIDMTLTFPAATAPPPLAPRPAATSEQPPAAEGPAAPTSCGWLQPLLNRLLQYDYSDRQSTFNSGAGSFKVQLYGDGTWESGELYISNTQFTSSRTTWGRRGRYQVDCATNTVVLDPLQCDSNNEFIGSSNSVDSSLSLAGQNRADTCVDDFRFGNGPVTVVLTPTPQGSVQVTNPSDPVGFEMRVF